MSGRRRPQRRHFAITLFHSETTRFEDVDIATAIPSSETAQNGSKPPFVAVATYSRGVITPPPPEEKLLSIVGLLSVVEDCSWLKDCLGGG